MSSATKKFPLVVGTLTGKERSKELQAALKSLDYRDTLAKELTSNVDTIAEEMLQMFTQQHYEKLAEIISKHLVETDSSTDLDAGQREGARTVLTAFAHELIQVFEKENPKFKPFKFIEAAFGKANELRKPKEK